MTAAGPETKPFRLRLPATSANLGSGFDAAAVALDFYLDIEAVPAAEFSVQATGRDAARCARLEDNLILGIYKRLLEESGKPIIPLAIRMQNDIPLGMGCGSSAAGRLAAICLAVFFGQLGWSPDQILEEASALEGHPDNVAACWLGGFVTALTEGRTVRLARLVPPSNWRAIVAIPPAPLATSKARAVLPESYSRADAVSNIQAVSLLGLAFAQGRGDLLRAAMTDRIHQPYREAICPMLPRLLPLAGQSEILGVALSGAGPSILIVIDSVKELDRVFSSIHTALSGLSEPELRVCQFELLGARDALSRNFP
ncbi:MAG TPA: homoserine kinase [Terracidiphilus sp.]|jgi:homoserine kinase|nr:homoserine kinase [Terracidiphilus sp.]